MRNYSSPTESAAIGAVDKELARMRKKAEEIKRLRQNGTLTRAQLIEARKNFKGIYRSILDEALRD